MPEDTFFHDDDNGNRLKELVSELKSRYAPRNERITTWRKLRRDEVKIDIPAAYLQTAQIVKLGLPKVWLRRVVSVLTARPFKVRIPPPINASADDRRLANKRERFLQAVWTAMERIQRQRLTLRLSDHVAGDGQGWLKLNFKPQVWEAMPSADEIFKDRAAGELTKPEIKEHKRRIMAWKRSAPVPFTVQVMDPATIYPVWDEDELAALVEMSRMPWGRVEGLVTKWGGHPRSFDDIQGESEVQVIEYWDKYRQVVYVEHSGTWRLVTSRTNVFKFIPYFHAPGWEEATTRPEEQFQSVLAPIEHTIPLIYKVLTMKLNRMYLASWLTWQSDSPPPSDTGDSTRRPYPLDIGYVIPKNQESQGITPVQIPAMTDDLEEIFAIMSSISESSQVDESAVGGSAGANESGYHRTLRAELARIPFSELSDGIATCIAACMERILEVIDLIVNDTVYVRYTDKKATEWIGLDPEEIDGNYFVNVQITSDDPLDNVARRTAASNEVTRGFIPHVIGLEEAGYENPEEVMDLLLFEKLMSHPMMLQLQVEHMMQRLGHSQGAGLMAGLLAGTAGAGAQGGGPGQQAGGSLGGRPPGQQQAPGIGAPVGAPANQPGPQQTRTT